MKHYLIAGGAGFIGSHLVERLMRGGNRVTIVDNFSTGSIKNIRPYLEDGQVDIIEQDISDPFEINEVFDIVFHLAEKANPADYIENRREILASQAMGTKNLIEISLQGHARFVYFSSSEIYGHQNKANGAIAEHSISNVRMHHPRSPYFISKMFGEEYTHNACNELNIDWIVIRPFNIYGPRMDIISPYGRVIPNFIRWASSDKPIRINGDGTQIRSFCHIFDFLDAIERIISVDTWEHRIVNVGDPKTISIHDLAKLVANACGRTNENFLFIPMDYEEPFFRRPNIDLIKNWLGWEPTHPFIDGIKDLIVNGYYKEIS